MKKIKVMQIITDTNIGGAGRYLMALLGSYDRERFTMEVILPQNSALKFPDTIVHEVPFIAEKSFSIQGIRVIRRLLKRIRPDIVSTHASLSGRIAAALCGCKIIFTRHYCVESRRIKLGFLHSMFSNAIVAVSPAVEQTLIQSGVNAEKVVTINSGVPQIPHFPTEKRAKIRERYGISETAFVVSQVARLETVKGHDYTLDAAKLLADDIVIVLAGEGSLAEHIQHRIETERLKNVVVTGFIEDVADIFNITDVQVCASATEAIGLSLLEGMSLGIPAVVSDAGANPFTVPHMERGLVVPYGNGAAIAEAVLRLKEDSGLYRKFADNCKAAYDEVYNVDSMTKQVEALYASVLKGVKF
ncbi:MAG: glycosyltransferase [Turicibacter sp.]|nr:glycosyltransferase [Turicibacter sp.]